ncbi:MAG: tRNA uridine-5-carboxymethylaminomethyl(34) synthesis GTPase MnmE [Opitutales bacterium]|nr:tRNA uridine-5-carboxymethylaminomethyl(34) synthesis GTPase MnmE [Opitutales bacterium]MCH8541438.1 tRNA uridine-5-carboxymethylaminomethyl(34) synthesis GTPase MnmE [Opitutales bacterium]
MEPSAPNEPIAALATPFGESAIALIRATGQGLEAIGGEIFQKKLPPRKAVFAPYRSREGDILDEVVVTFFASPQSYTGEDILEISCHGNPLICEKILRDLSARGIRAAEPGEFTRRAFLNGKMDLSQAEAVIDLIRARGDRALEAAQHQIKGVLGDQIRKFVDRLLQILAEIEAYIDFPEEDLPAEDHGGPLGELKALIDQVVRLAATSHYGALLREGVKVALIGAPNAGKSSLLNLLLSRERALVSDTPGTTRDFLEETVHLGKHCLRILDTAGLHLSEDPLECAGMEKTIEQLELADICLWVIDQTNPNFNLPVKARDSLPAKRTFVLFNKSDLAGASPPPKSPEDFPALSMSAKTGEGLDGLIARIDDLVEKENPGHQRDWIAVSARHAEALEEARSTLEKGLALLRQNEPVELAASELHNAIDAFARIVGKIDNEEMLDRLFATFCIGK